MEVTGFWIKKDKYKKTDNISFKKPKASTISRKYQKAVLNTMAVHLR